MSFTSVNLASRPFSNQTPVMRAAVALGLLGLVLLAVNAVLYWSYFSGSGEEARAELARVDGDIARAQARLEDLDRQIAAFDLEALRTQVEFLNLRISERTFAWSQLFEDLGEVLPPAVRLTRLSPSLGRAERGGAPTSIELGLEGTARNDEAVLALIDALFAHPRFSDPDPSREARREGELQFNLTVVYEPPSRRSAEAEASSESPEPATPEPVEEGA